MIGVLGLAVLHVAANPCTPIPAHAVIAHRGASYDAPEETRAAYERARAIGADYLELDIQRTRDGHLIALHDATFFRTTDSARVFPDKSASLPNGVFTNRPDVALESFAK